MTQVITIKPSRHSEIVGGSTAKQVINCPGSVALSRTVPRRPAGDYAAIGTMLHYVISEILGKDKQPEIGSVYRVEGKDYIYTEELHEKKILKALELLDTEVDPERSMEFEVETEVSFDKFIPGVFGSIDLTGRIGKRATILDWKFGDGVIVDAEDNEQGMFYAAAAMRTKDTAWAFEEVDEVEIIIIQPPDIRRWVTTKKRLKQFELLLQERSEEARGLVKVVEQLLAEHGSSWSLYLPEDFPLMEGDHCRWCKAKPVCPLMNGAVEKALSIELSKVNLVKAGLGLEQCDLLEQWIKDFRAMAHHAQESGLRIPGWKLVDKRASRKWKDEVKAKKQLLCFGEIKESDIMTVPELLSPAQTEEVLKKHKLELPKELVESVSSGTVLVKESDKRPEVLKACEQHKNTLAKLTRPEKKK